MRKFVSKHFKPILIFLLVLVFWCPVVFNNNFFIDDNVFLNACKNGTAGLGYIFTPHNEHFMPLFKAIFGLMYLLFGDNIVPYISLLVLMHAINTLLFYYLCMLVFPKNKNLPFYATLFFMSNTSYFEVLHWFTLLSAALPLFFLLVALLTLHLYCTNNNKALLATSLVSSFFMPMNFNLGIISVFILLLYYQLVIKKSLKIKALAEGIKTLWPYALTWLFYMLIFAIAVLNKGKFLTESATRSFSIGKVIERIFAGFIGFFMKSLGMNITYPPINLWVAGFLLFNFVAFSFIFALYLVLNAKRSRISILNDKYVSAFALFSALLCYGVIAVARTGESPDFFLNYGRYQYFPAIFLSIFIANMMPALISIFSGIFNKKRFKYYLLFLFCLYLIGHFAIIRDKSFSGIRTEGSLPIQHIYALTDKNTSAGI